MFIYPSSSESSSTVTQLLSIFIYFPSFLTNVCPLHSFYYLLASALSLEWHASGPLLLSPACNPLLVTPFTGSKTEDLPGSVGHCLDLSLCLGLNFKPGPPEDQAHPG